MTDSDSSTDPEQQQCDPDCADSIMRIRIRSGRNLFIWFAVMLVIGTLAFFGLYVPTYRQTIFTFLRVYIRTELLYPESQVNKYDVYQPVVDELSEKCIRLPGGEPNPWICIHPIEVDRFISGYIADGSRWEGEICSLFEDLLNMDPDLALIDIGANIGEYSVLALALGRRVLAVDARLAHIQMLHHAVVLNGAQENATLVHNAIADIHTMVTLQLSKDNQGATKVVHTDMQNICPKCSTHTANHVSTITLDDLREVVSFEKAILKIDIEGDEAKALLHASKLFQNVFIPFVIMEWSFMKKITSGESEELVDLMYILGYSAHTIYRTPLKNTDYKTWPNDIVWKHRNVDL